jgi:hypothetical protein|tara:strand:+ start:164 stop:349 length:186 start_codon:yes stop_codon:yes gene_type:complete
MNSFNTQQQIDDMWEADLRTETWEAYVASIFDDRTNEQDVRWENICMDVNNEYQDNQPKPW